LVVFSPENTFEFTDVTYCELYMQKFFSNNFVSIESKCVKLFFHLSHNQLCCND